MPTLILLRHGESEWNAKNLFTGWVDVDLTAKGEEQARRGGELLRLVHALGLTALAPWRMTLVLAGAPAFLIALLLLLVLGRPQRRRDDAASRPEDDGAGAGCSCFGCPIGTTGALISDSIRANSASESSSPAQSAETLFIALRNCSQSRNCAAPSAEPSRLRRTAASSSGASSPSKNI